MRSGLRASLRACSIAAMRTTAYAWSTESRTVLISYHVSGNFDAADNTQGIWLATQLRLTNPDVNGGANFEPQPPARAISGTETTGIWYNFHNNGIWMGQLVAGSWNAQIVYEAKDTGIQINVGRGDSVYNIQVLVI